MRFLWIIVISVFLFSTKSEGQNRFKDVKNIYLLDVTLSMWGQAPDAKNIFDNVRMELIKAIESINNPKTEIVVVTFQDKVLDTWSSFATASGKDEIIDKLKSIDPETLTKTRTNIYAPLAYAKRLIDPSKTSVIFLLTDGEHNMTEPTKQELYNEVRNWGIFSKNKDYYAFLVELVDNANDPELRNVINSTNNIQIIQGIKFYIIGVEDNKPIININDELVFSLNFVGNQILELPEDFTFTLKSNSPLFKVANSELKLKNKPFNIKLIPNSSIEELINDLPVPQSTIPLSLHYEQNKYPNIKLLNNKIDLTIKNIKEMVLKIEVLND